ncbi:hypothetical protein [Candidatus Lokiarchaeum ossiferum]|uniref:hypothetical protein n=1 Tax=Candidatus Lokiarchaeum ossiferum TaxID=2951803 RepID=UPI00352BFD24
MQCEYCKFRTMDNGVYAFPDHFCPQETENRNAPDECKLFQPDFVKICDKLEELTDKVQRLVFSL